MGYRLTFARTPNAPILVFLRWLAFSVVHRQEHKCGTAISLQRVARMFRY